MPEQTFHFNPAGGPLSARPSAGQAAKGSYGLLLVEHDGITLVKPSPWKADFNGAASNTHQLPESASDSDGRILDLVYSVGLMDATRAYAVHLTVLQDGSALGTASDVGTDAGTGPTHPGKILVVLSAAPALTGMNASVRSLLKSAKPKGKKRAPSSASRRNAVKLAAHAQLGGTARNTNRSGKPPRRGTTKGGGR